LGLIREHWPLNDLCDLLFNPFWSDAEPEMLLRTQLAARLRGLGKFEVTGSDLRFHAQAIAESLKPPSAPREEMGMLARRLQQFDEYRRRLPSRAGARQWGQQFSQLLQLLGWPGPRRL